MTLIFTCQLNETVDLYIRTDSEVCYLSLQQYYSQEICTVKVGAKTSNHKQHLASDMAAVFEPETLHVLFLDLANSSGTKNGRTRCAVVFLSSDTASDSANHSHGRVYEMFHSMNMESSHFVVVDSVLSANTFLRHSNHLSTRPCIYQTRAPHTSCHFLRWPTLQIFYPVLSCPLLLLSSISRPIWPRHEMVRMNTGHLCSAPTQRLHLLGNVNPSNSTCCSASLKQNRSRMRGVEARVFM